MIGWIIFLTELISFYLCPDIIEALLISSNKKPLYCDIELPTYSGFYLVKKTSWNASVPIIFRNVTTSLLLWVETLETSLDTLEWISFQVNFVSRLTSLCVTKGMDGWAVDKLFFNVPIMCVRTKPFSPPLGSLEKFETYPKYILKKEK